MRAKVYTCHYSNVHTAFKIKHLRRKEGVSSVLLYKPLGLLYTENITNTCWLAVIFLPILSI